MVVEDGVVRVSLVYNHHHSLLDVLKCSERFQEVSGQLRQLISSGLTNVRIIDNEDNLHFGVDVQKTLNEERV